MPLAKWGGLPKGVNRGLRDPAADNAALNRLAGLGGRTEADTLAAAGGELTNGALDPQAEGGRPNARILNVDDIAARIPHLDEAGKNFVRQVMAAYGYPPGSRISQVEARALQQAALRDPRVVSGLLKQLRRGLAADILNAEQELRDLYRAEPRTGLEGAALKAAIGQKQAEIQDLMAKLEEMNATGPRRPAKTSEFGAGEPENAGAGAPPAGTVTINGRQYTKILMDPETGDEFGVLPDGTRELVKQCVIPRAAAAPTARPDGRGSGR